MRRSAFTSVIDAALESTVVGSFSKIGFAVRDKLQQWEDEPRDLSGQLAVVTGATSGIGNATAAGLLDLGAGVIITSRSQDRADDAAAELNAAARAGQAEGLSLDTSDFDSIDAFVAALESRDQPIDMLINNAGALTDEYQRDERGMELTLSSHLVGPYRLMNLLREQLSPGARLLFMSSGGMYTQGLDVDEIEMDERNYRGAVAYARAKRGQVEMVSYLGPRWAPGVIMHSMHPGWVDTPGVDAGLPGFGRVMGPILRDAQQGADTMIWLAASAPVDEPGRFWLDRKARRTAYLPTTGTDDNERRHLIEWLNEQAGLAD